MEDYQQRVIDEKKELITKINNLTYFISTDTFELLPMEEQKRMIHQKIIMEKYINILTDRINFFHK